LSLINQFLDNFFTLKNKSCYSRRSQFGAPNSGSKHGLEGDCLLNCCLYYHSVLFNCYLVLLGCGMFLLLLRHCSTTLRINSLLEWVFGFWTENTKCNRTSKWHNNIFMNLPSVIIDCRCLFLCWRCWLDVTSVFELHDFHLHNFVSFRLLSSGNYMLIKL
jgi:hypothetical protein